MSNLNNKTSQYKSEIKEAFKSLEPDNNGLLEKKQLAIYCCNNYGPMIGEYYKNDVDFINNLDFDCSLSLEKVFTSKKDIFTTANNYNQFYLKELEIYKLNIYN